MCGGVGAGGGEVSGQGLLELELRALGIYL